MISDFIKGVLKYIDALGLMQRWGLMHYFFYSGMIGLVIMAALVVLITLTYTVLSSLLVSVIPWDIGFLPKVTDFLSAAFLSVFFFILFKHLMLIFTSPLMSILSEKVELKLEGSDAHYYRNKSIASEIVRGLRISVRNIIRELFYTLLLLIIGLIPVFTIFSTPGLILVQGFYAGFGNYDFWAERHFTYRGTVDFVRDHKPMVAANGVIFLVLLAIPLVGVFIAPPLATVAATIHAHEKIDGQYGSDTV